MALCGLLFTAQVIAEEKECPGGDSSPSVVQKADLARLSSVLRSLKDTQGRIVWKDPENIKASLPPIFETQPVKTKLNQFYELLYVLQQHIDPALLPVEVKPPQITELLLAARVFTDLEFPRKIMSVKLERNKSKSAPLYSVIYADVESRFPINEGQGFSSWDQGMCQIAKELVFNQKFSFRVRKASHSKNLIVEDFDGVEIYGQFGTRKVFKIDLNYVDLEKVEFIAGTDEGKVKARVAKREFRENKHSALFKFIGTMIPNTSRQRIDW